MTNPKAQERPPEDPYTCSTSELQEFIDPPGGAPLDEGLARPRHGVPARNQIPDRTQEKKPSPPE